MIPVEIVRYKDERVEWWAKLIASLLGLALRTLVIWWAVATWFPEFGWTYWQLVLPVYALPMLFNTPDLTSWRALGKKRSEVRQLP